MVIVHTLLMGGGPNDGMILSELIDPGSIVSGCSVRLFGIMVIVHTLLMGGGPNDGMILSELIDPGSIVSGVVFVCSESW
jgi:hypothetical protein